ncbi:MAG TPA: dephospho-CoA kinase, partial [Gammaproteobacteria bacterium]|nr:dephospho-CoA kinase [Gammaproteobacteria bacterium]
MLKVGLTGGIGCGKTTVSNHFKALGVPVIDADEISRELVQPGLPAYRAIVEAFGPSILTPRGELDRAGLRRLIFADTEAKLALEAILHPRIQQTISDKIKTLDSQYCIIVIPLLVETGEYSLLDRVLVIDAARELQISRTLARDKISREQVEAMLASQVDRTTR